MNKSKFTKLFEQSFKILNRKPCEILDHTGTQIGQRSKIFFGPCDHHIWKATEISKSIVFQTVEPLKAALCLPPAEIRAVNARIVGGGGLQICHSNLTKLFWIRNVSGRNYACFYWDLGALMLLCFDRTSFEYQSFWMVSSIPLFILIYACKFFGVLISFRFGFSLDMFLPHYSKYILRFKEVHWCGSARSNVWLNHKDQVNWFIFQYRIFYWLCSPRVLTELHW